MDYEEINFKDEMGTETKQLLRDGEILYEERRFKDGNGEVEYLELYKNGVLHNENGPAVLYKNGSEEWYLNGVLHRDRYKGPAVKRLLAGKWDEQWWEYGGLVDRRRIIHV